MIPPFDAAGNLPPGIHWASWDEVAERFGTSQVRIELLDGLKRALRSLLEAGCRTLYVDGSFVTSKEVPGDFDACWDPQDVDGDRLEPVLLDFTNRRAAQKAEYRGELFPSVSFADPAGNTFLEFFQIDRRTGEPKGIVAIDLKKVSL
ncbi:MAG TPA: hypothetical protein VLX28_27550 [Thermoanaerobaculia bacterium]|nr:hypothetical protein [Thermoanaerobaculia bacterium]